MDDIQKAERSKQRYAHLLGRISRQKQELAERLAETKRLFVTPALAVEIHTHSIYSDGVGTVEENYECAMNAGLDFMFATDHWQIGQKEVTDGLEHASWGQEPGGRYHHIGLLCNTLQYVDQDFSTAENFDRAKLLTPFAWIPHPTGWYGFSYKDEAVEKLWTLGNEFAMETMNGGDRLFQAYDEYDERAIQVWDQLLCDGRRIISLGGSDAHLPDDIGSVWTAVMTSECNEDAIIKTLQAGHCYSSEASLLDFQCDGQPMNSVLKRPSGADLKLTYRVADSAGLQRIRIISMGQAIDEIFPKGGQLITGELTTTCGITPAYYRLEVQSTDNRRAFSTPIYFEPA